MPKKEKAANLIVELTGSLIGCKDNQIATAHALGLRKIGDKSIQPQNPMTQGKLRVVNHLVKVTEA